MAEETRLDSLADLLRSSRKQSRALTVVVTGANSGIGLCAAKLLALINPLNRIVLAARTLEKAQFAKTEVESVLSDEFSDCQDHIIPLECDHCSIESVKSFVSELRRKLASTYRKEKWAHRGIDVLCLNAAVLVAEGSDPCMTADGFETTFQTNHLAPFLIANLTFNLINPGGRVVFSTSGLHVRNNLDFSGIIDPVTGDIRQAFEMMDGTEFHYKRSYALAKLANVATCAELDQRLLLRGAISTCFSPGLMLTTGLFRNQRNPTLAIPAAQRDIVLLKGKSLEWGAGSLVYMAIADETGKRGCEYWSDTTFAGCSAAYGKEFCSVPISEETVEEDERKVLWQLSCRLAGIPCDL